MKITYQELLDRRVQVLMGTGMTFDQAYPIASEQAHINYSEALRERGDALKDRMKEEGQWPPK